MTAAHCLNFPKNQSTYLENKTYNFSMKTNEFHRSYESMLTVYVGLHNTGMSDTTTGMHVKKIMVVKMIRKHI